MSKSYFECQLIAFSTITYKEVRRFLRIWIQTLLPTPITVLLYFLIFGSFLGPRLGSVGHVSYVMFMTPGLIMFAVINNSFSNVVSSFFGAKFQRNIEELLVSPVEPLVILLGFVAGGVLRGLLVGGIVLMMTQLMLGYHVASYGLSFAIALLTALFFSLAGLLNALFANKFDDISIIPTFVLTPMIYLGGVFYDANSLPVSFRWLIYFNPLYYMINGFRAAFIGHSDTSIEVCLFLLTIASLFLLILNTYLLKKRKNF